MNVWALAGLSWLCGASCMWLWLDLRRMRRQEQRCACGKYTMQRAQLAWIRDGDHIHEPERCQPYGEWLR